MAAIRHVGLIGVGLMGHGLAKNILKAGFDLTFQDHQGNGPVDDLRASGAKSVATSAEIAKACDMVALCVNGSPEIAAILHGENGVLAGLSDGTIVVDFSTAMPEATLKEAEAVRAKGGRYVDAPMTRTPKEAEEGRLNLMVGGEEDDIAAVRPVLEALAENIYMAGGLSAGHRMKLLHNFLALGNAALLAEAVTVAAKGGVDLTTLCEVFRTGGANSVALERLQPYVLEGDGSSFRFSIANARKDMEYYTAMASALDVPSFGAEAVHQLYITASRLWKGNEAPTVPALFDILGDLVDTKSTLK